MYDPIQGARLLVFVGLFALTSFGCGGAPPAQDEASHAETTVETPEPPAEETAEATPEQPAEEPATSELSDDDYGFTVALPDGFAKPTRTSEVIETEVGSIELVTYMLLRGEDACAVAVSKYPADKIEAKPTREILRDSLDGSLRETGATADRRETYQTAQGHPAGSAHASASDDETGTFYLRLQNIFVRPRLYQVTCFALDKATLSDPAIEEFFSSFRVRAAKKP